MLKKLFITLCVLLVLAGGAVVAVPMLLPYADLEGIVKTKVREATGRDIAFSSARLSVFPAIAIVLDDVTFSNASWAKDKNMLELKQLDLSLALRPLLSRRVEVKRFVLKSPVIHLEKNTDGGGNWEFAEAGKKAPAVPEAGGSGGQKFAFTASNMKISGASLTYADRAKNSMESLSDLDVDVSASDMSSPMKLKGAGTYRGKHVTLAAEIADPQAFLDGKPSPASLSLDGEGLSAKIAGHVATAGTMLDGTIDADVAQLSSVAGWLGGGASKLPFEKLSFKSAAKATATQLTLKDAALKLDDIDAKGDVTAHFGGRTQIDAKLSMGKLNLDRFAPEKTGGTATPAPETAASQEWDAAPIDFSPLKSLDADFVLNTQGFTLRGAEVGPSVLTVALKGGALHFTSSEATLFGGKFSSSLNADAGGNVGFKFNMAGVDAKPVLTTFAHFKKLSGKADAQVAVTTQGGSQKALVAGLNGTGSVVFKNGSLEGIDLARIAKLLQSHFSEMTAGEGSTEFVEMGGTFNIAKGVAANNDFKLKGPLVQATGTGQIDLPQKVVAYRVLPVLTLSSAENASGLSVPVDIRGPFSNIKIHPDYGSVIQNALKNPDQIKNMVKDVKPMLKDIRKDPASAIMGILGVKPPPAAAPEQPPQPEAPPAPAPPAPAP